MSELDDIKEDQEGQLQVDESQEEKPKAPEGYVSLEDNNHQVNKQHKKFRDEERARLKAEEKAATLEKELEELRAKSVDLTIPPMPDPLDENFDEKVRLRDEKIKAVSAHEVELSQKEQQAKDHEQEAKNSQIEAKDAQVAAFNAQTVTLGLNPQEIGKAAKAVVEYGISEVLEDAVLEDPDGPLLVQVLASNPVKLHELNSMTAFQAFKALEEMRPQALLLKPKNSQAPDPPDILSGGGVGEIEDPLLKGVTYE